MAAYPDIHGYWAEYATAIYRTHTRAIQDIPYDRINRGTGRQYQSEVYVCRKDKAAMLVCGCKIASEGQSRRPATAYYHGAEAGG